MEACLILNPAAGRLASEAVVGDAETGEATEAVLRRLAQRYGARVECTEKARSAGDITREALQRGARVVIAVGGDGTVSEVVNGMADHLDEARLVIVPMGTANDFAGTLGLPAGDVEKALEVLEPGKGVERRVDLIRVEQGGGGSHYMLNAATGGFSEVVHDRLTDDVKRNWGPLAYLRAAVEAAPDMVFHRARVTVDGETIDAETASVVVANGRSAGGMELTPAARVDDGKMDVVVVTAKTFFEQMRLSTRFAVGRHLESPHVAFRRGATVRVECDPPMHFSSDGELIGRTPLTFHTLRQALRVLVPA